MSTLVNIIMYLWQLPQNIAGAILFCIYSILSDVIVVDEGTSVSIYTSIKGGLSLGAFNFLQRGYYRNPSKYVTKTILHTKGHSKQSRILGPLYIIVIGVPSLIWKALWTCFKYFRNKDYYSFYTEKWADKLAGVER